MKAKYFSNIKYSCRLFVSNKLKNITLGGTKDYVFENSHSSTTKRILKSHKNSEDSISRK